MTIPLQIEITSDGKPIGRISPEQFCKSFGVPKSAFLADGIKRFNERKAEANEPERAEIVLIR